MPLMGKPSSTDRAIVGVHDQAQGNRRMRLLVFSSLYPNAEQPLHGMFVEARLRHLVDSGRVGAIVVAPVPWFPFRSPRFGTYAAMARVPSHDERHGLAIEHPRYPVIPKVGMSLAPSLMVRALLPVLRKLQANGSDFDLIDAHYFYPDGVAAVRIGAALGKPVVITARGSDITLIPNHRRPRRQILWAAERAAAIATVSGTLKDKLVRLGARPGKITVLRNGVDLDRFRPLDRAAIRTRLALAGTVWLTVGHLIALKGVHLAIEALAKLPDTVLLIAGHGPEESRLRALVATLGVGARVHFLGALAQDQLSEYYNAADALVHASSHEGMPNVLLEALACGTPVVAAPFEGVRELLDAPEAGEVASVRSGDAIVDAWLRLRHRAPTRAATRAHAEQFGWPPVVDAQCALYARVLAMHGQAHAC